MICGLPVGTYEVFETLFFGESVVYELLKTDGNKVSTHTDGYWKVWKRGPGASPLDPMIEVTGDARKSVVKKFLSQRNTKKMSDDCFPNETSPCTSQSLSVSDFKKAIDSLTKANIPRYDCIAIENYSTQSCCVEECSPTPMAKKKGKAMYYDDDECGCDTTIESQRLSYLRSRASSVYYSKDGELPKAFGFARDAAPQTFEELKERILGGKYQIDEKDAKKYAWPYGLAHVTWKDPAVKEDQAGLDAALAALTKKYTEVKDAILIKSADEGLAAVKDFEATTFH